VARNAAGPRREDRGLRPARAQDRDGIADVGFALMAWIVDPRKNALAIMELKG
jgi:hypothetical protein